MMVKPKMIFGLPQENSFIAITWNPESNCTCREKNHFLFHWSFSTSPEQHKRIWMSSKRNASMIIGTWMGKECQMHGQDSQDSFYKKERPPEGYTWCGERLTRKQSTSRSDDMARYVGSMCLTQRKRKQNKDGLSRNVTRTTDTTSDVMSEKHIEDDWIVDGDRELSDA